MKSWIIRTLAVVAMAVVTTMGLVAPSPASAAPAAVPAVSRATLKAAAEKVAYEVVGGSNYAKYKAKYPTQLNWGNDGCSVPAKVKKIPGIGAIVKKLDKMWQHSCDRHDFGYRNFGSNTSTAGPHPEFSPTEATRKKIDKRFQSNMKVQCTQQLTGIKKALRPLCKKAADVYYGVVRELGGSSFFG